MDIDDLVGAAEIAELLEIADPHTVHNWRRRYSDFPEPVVKLRQGLVWAWPDVEHWARRSDRWI